MIKALDEDRLSAENEIRLFLRLFPLLAAHFQLKEDIEPDSLFNIVADKELLLRMLAEEYEGAVEDELYGDEKFVFKLPSVIKYPLIKKPIINPDE